MSVLAQIQSRIASAMGVTPDDMRVCLVDMLGRSGKFPAQYWLQIILSLGIATFGLVLGSTAVVIGAMLVSPLMTPIVELAMGLAVGSPFLVLRSAARIAMSVATVVVASAMIVRTLPFHEVTSEIAARTSPNILDLAVAVFCAGAAAYTTIRRGADTSATAAGTAVGIALVPPLCVVGYGLGSEDVRIAAGAALLFTANLSAIVLFDAAAFVFLGYGNLDVAMLEDAELAQTGDQRGIGRIARRLYRFFHSRYGRIMRTATPLVLVGAIFVPLRTALREVAWEVGARSSIQTILAGVSRRSVRSSVTVDHHEIVIRLVIVGSADDAKALRQDLLQRIGASTGVEPEVHVLAVPDVESLRKNDPLPAPAPEPETSLATLRECIDDSLPSRWPTNSVGALVEWRVEISEAATTTIHVVHIGAPLGSAAEQVLAVDLRRCVGAKTPRILDHAFPDDARTANADAGGEWLASVLPELNKLANEPRLHACVEIPPDGGAALETALAPLGPRAQIMPGATWSLRVRATDCPRVTSSSDVDASLDGGEE